MDRVLTESGRWINLFPTNVINIPKPDNREGVYELRVWYVNYIKYGDIVFLILISMEVFIVIQTKIGLIY